MKTDFSKKGGGRPQLRTEEEPDESLLWGINAVAEALRGRPRSLSEVLIEKGRAMGDAPEAIKRRHIYNCSKADPAYGAGVAKALGLA